MKKNKTFPPNRPISIACISLPRLEGKRAKIKPNKLIENRKLLIDQAGDVLSVPGDRLLYIMLLLPY